MGIDAKEIGTMVWKIIGFSMNTTSRFIQNHPVFSGASIFLLMLYFFFPFVVYFSIYFSLVLACLIVFTLKNLNLTRPEWQKAEEKSCLSLESKNSRADRNVVRSHLKHQRSVRRNARRKVEEWDWQTSEEEKDKIILTSLYNDLLGRTPHFEESQKAAENDVDKDEAPCGGESSQKLGSSRLSYHDLVVLGGQKLASSDYGTEEELDSKEDRGDQKNSVMEPGISDIERNMRLESLIARRRAKRLFKLVLDQKNMMNGGERISPVQNIPHISVLRNNGGLLGVDQDNSSGDVGGLQMPGSAPSVLLPTRNPFDLPYDPQEERPNLKGDSFDQEFSAITQKDIFFSRHESFYRSCLYFPEAVQDANRPDPSSSIQRTATRAYLDTGNHYENRAKQEVPQEGETKNNMEEDKDGSVDSGKSVKQEAKLDDGLETDSNKEEDSGSSSSKESEQEFNSLNRAQLREAIRQTMGKFPDLLGSQPRNPFPSPLPKGVPPRIEDHHLFYAGRCTNSHARTFSIASDLQVEVSEIGSPPTTIDGRDDSSHDEESYMYDTDIEREIAHRGDELQKRVSHPTESKPTTETEAKEETSSEIRNSSNEEKPLIAVSPSKQVPEQARKTKEHIKQVVEKLIDHKPYDSSDAFSFANFGKLRVDKDMIHTSISLSSIAEEPETIMDSADGGNQENVKQIIEELVSQTPLSSLDSLAENQAYDEADMQDSEQNENEESHGSIGKINSEDIDHVGKVIEAEKNRKFSETANREYPEKLSNRKEAKNTSNNIPVDQDIESVQECENKEGIDGLSVSKINQNSSEKAFLAQPTDSLLEKEKMQDEVVYSRLLDDSAKDIKSESIKRATGEVSEEKELKSVENTNKDTKKSTEHEDNVSNACPGHRHTESLEIWRDVENASEVIVSQVNEELKDPTTLPWLADLLATEEEPKDNNQTFGESNEQEILKEGKDDTKPVQVYNNKDNAEESTVLLNTENSDGSVFYSYNVEPSIQQINGPDTDMVDTKRVHTLDKLPSLKLVTPVALESTLKPQSIEISTVQMEYDKDFHELQEPSEAHEISVGKITIETSFEVVKSEETTSSSHVHKTQEKEEGITDSSGGLLSQRSDNIAYCVGDSVTLEMRDEGHSSKLIAAEEDITQELEPENETVNISRKLSEVANDSMVNEKKEKENLISIDQGGEAIKNVSVRENEELRPKSDPFQNSTGLVARKDGEEPRRQIEAKNIVETSKQAEDVEGTIETTKAEHKISDLS